MAANPKDLWTVEAYLAFERESDVKHEYFAGEIFAMAGAEPGHVDVRSNVQFSLMKQLKGRPCKVHDNDMRVKTPSGLYTYPGISVVCGDRHFNDDKPRTLLNPTVIVEVLSPTTEAYDRGDKFRQYRSLPSLQEYILIASTQKQVELWARQTNDTWRITVVQDDDGSIELTSIDCTLSIADVYDGVTFDQP